MAKPSIADLVVTQTFQNWFDKTNELTGIIRSEAVTASAGGDSTTGNATLVGNFTATNLIGDVSTDDIEAATNGGSVTFGSPTIHNALSDGICATFEFGAGGGKTRYTDTNISWDIGLEDSTNGNFIIDTGVGARKFSLSPSGTLNTTNIILSEDARGNNAIFNNGDFEDLTANNITYTGSISGPSGDNILAGDLYVSGDGYFEGDVVTAYTASDKRLKENIEIIDGALDKVEQINGYTFNYIAKPEERVAGVIAQEVEKVLPGVTFDLDDKGHKAVRYDNIIPLLIQAIKELNDKVESLEKSKD
jgi:hypothetical protein